MHTECDGLILIYEKIQGGVRLLRVYGKEPIVTLPCCIEDSKILEIGDYCFAGRAKLAPEIIKEIQENGLGDGNSTCEKHCMRPICGDYLHKIVLSDEIAVLGDYVFYGCNKLMEISMGSNLINIGSDVFMNCKKLCRLIMRVEINSKTILEKLLSQINNEIEVVFVPSIDNYSTCQVRILYPLYTETYELLGPAHIFGLNLQGEGYRARKQFKDGLVDLAGYDQIFAKARHEEGFTTLMRMAINRLEYPVALTKDAKSTYEKYVRDNEERILCELVKAEEIGTIETILKSGLISPLGKKAAIETAISTGRVTFVSKLISL